MTGYVPKRGDIVWTNFDPSAGHEQARKRPALVLSPELFNQKIKLALVVPITSKVRGHGFEVALTGTATEGVVLCHQMKTIDFNTRGIALIEEAPDQITREVLAKVKVLVS